MKLKNWLMVGVALIAGFVGGAASGRIFRAQANQTKSSISKDGAIIIPATGLIFKTPEGKVLARMDVDQAGGRFGVYHFSGEPSAVMGTAADGGGFAAYSKEGHPTGSLGTAEGHGVLGLFDNKGKTLFEAP